MADNRVKVRIYGQEYTITGERDEETIVSIADYVDRKIREVGQFFTSSQPGSLATLAAVNMADEVFALRDEAAALRAEKEQLEKDAEHYMEMWDDAKKSFVQYKEGANKANDDMNELKDKLTALEEKCADYESAYFDLQMENLQLKDRLDKLEK